MNKLSLINGWRWLCSRAAASERRDVALVGKIREIASGLRSVSDQGLAHTAAELRQASEHCLDLRHVDTVAPCFALVVEAARRTLGIELYDVQLLGGLALSRGAVAEMQTGEGKTLAAMAPSCLLALPGRGVHVMTVNAYLARRDFELLSPAHRLLGFSVGLIEANTSPDVKRSAYGCDITYGPGYEFGFDYLRDQAALLSLRKPRLGESLQARLQGRSLEKPQPMQRGHAAAIVDEADSVMIDEATIPLILSGAGAAPPMDAKVYQAAKHTAGLLQEGRDYVANEADDAVHFTRAGAARLNALPDGVPRSMFARPWQLYVEQALRARHHFHRDVHYVVRDEKIQLVDQNTGRIFSDRFWRAGLQQAVQTKEGVPITAAPQTIARVTRQRYFGLYRHLCGMTGTAAGSERELREIYGLVVTVIPPNTPCRRTSFPLRIFRDRTSKEGAIVEEIVRIHGSGQPVLVGATAIEISERLARLLGERGVVCQLLNGKQDAEEAEIIGRAGALGAVTIATNMAGRGADIPLADGAADRGGLHVIAAAPQESARVDRQLVGRAGRQGDPGSCQMFASADDPLFRRHSPALARRIEAAAADHGEVPDPRRFSRPISKLQRKVEAAQARRRRENFVHDDWLKRVAEDLM